MKILALDTACHTASCAVSENGVILAESSIHGMKTHSQKLMPLVAALLHLLDLQASDIDAFAVSSGPGSFTGLRIGVVTAKSLAYGAGRPVFGIPTLEALAFTVPCWEGTVCSVLDARNQQAYCGFYKREDAAIKRLRQDEAMHVDQLANALLSFDSNVLLVGDCAEHFAELLRRSFTETQTSSKVYAANQSLFSTRAAAVALLAESKPASGESGDPFILEPNYLRMSQAERMFAGRANAK